MDQRKVLTSSCSFLRPGITQASLVVLYTLPFFWPAGGLLMAVILALTKLSLFVTAHCGQQNCECAAAACNNYASSKPSHRSRRALSWQGAEHWSETEDLLPKPTLDVNVGTSTVEIQLMTVSVDKFADDPWAKIQTLAVFHSCRH